MKKSLSIVVIASMLSLGIANHLWAGTISVGIQNAGFENSDVATGTSDDLPTSWTKTDVTYWAGTGDVDYLSDIAAPLDGTKQFCWANGEYGNKANNGLYQVLSHSLQANATYVLSVDIGYRNGLLGGGAIHLGYGDTPNANFLTASSAVNAAPSSGSWTTWTATFETGDNPTGLGQNLRIELLAGNSVQTLFDNVRLTETVPEPGTVTLIASGLIGLVAYAWRKRR